MNWMDVGKKIAEIGCPMLGMAIGGFPGSILGEQVAKLFGANVNDPMDMINKIMKDPNAAIKLAEIESKRSSEIQEINFELVRLKLDHISHRQDSEFDDVEDARKMMISTHEWMPKVLTIIISLSLMSFLVYLLKFPIPSENNTILMSLLALIGYQFWNACRFWFGGYVPTIKTIKEFLGRK